jgi:uncharacterized protein GlcG (DUF336 family)
MCDSTATMEDKMLTGKSVVTGCFAAILSLSAGSALAGGGGNGNCGQLPGWSQLKNALTKVVNTGGNGGLGFNMWGTIVDNSGIVCAVAFSGSDFTSQWLGSRAISAQKANTGNAFSLAKNSPPASGSLFPTGLALSTANLYSAVQPGGSLYGLQASNPVETDVAYGNFAWGQGNGPANAASFGTPNDPLVGERVGGVNVFGGGLGLYQNGVRLGGLGVSGDTSCTDHMVAWRTRNALGYDYLSPVKGVSGDSQRPDNIVFDITPNPYGGTGISAGGFGHPTCINNPTPSALPAAH